MSASEEANGQPDKHHTLGTLAVPDVHGFGWRLFTRWAFVYSFAAILGAGRIPIPGLNLFISSVRTGSFDLMDKVIPNFAKIPGHWVFGDILFALTFALVWVAVDRWRKGDAVIHEIARVMSRYYLAGMLIYYAAEKFLSEQGVQSHEALHLMPQFGDLNGWEAMMTWLSFSFIYAYFAGIAEFAAGLLMFWRRFTTLAALLCLADMGMVWLINRSYWDNNSAAFAPLSFAPLALFLLAPQIKRLVDVLILNRGAVAKFVYLKPPPLVRWGGLALKIVAVPWLINTELVPQYWAGLIQKQGDPIQGNWRVVEFERNGVAEPLAAEHPNRWQEVAINPLGDAMIGVRTVGDQFLTFYAIAPEWLMHWVQTTSGRDRAKHNPWLDQISGEKSELDVQLLSTQWHLQTLKQDKPAAPMKLHFLRREPDVLSVWTIYGIDSLNMKLRRIPKDSMPHFQYRWRPI